MTDLSTTIEPKSDQLNADDLIAGPRTVRITKLSANPSSPEQPVSIYFDGDNGKPYKPCKSMRRVLVHCWGTDGSKFAGRSMTLYRDPSVRFGGFETGGIRISHMSDIKGPMTMALTATRASRKPFTVEPLRQIAAQTLASEPNTTTLDAARKAARGGSDVFATWWKEANTDQRADANTIKAEIAQLRSDADAKKKADPDTGEIIDGEAPEFGAFEARELGSLHRRENRPRRAPQECNIEALVEAYLEGWDEADTEMQTATKGK